MAWLQALINNRKACWLASQYRKSRQQITVLILKISVVVFIAKADCQHCLSLEGLALSFSQFVWTEGVYSSYRFPESRKKCFHAVGS